jgi:hypothetical protein
MGMLYARNYWFYHLNRSRRGGRRGRRVEEDWVGGDEK